jgi:hypothetical protein
MNETGVKIIIEGDATGAVAAARQASDALTQLQADTAGSVEAAPQPPASSDGHEETVCHPVPPVREAAVPARNLDLPPTAEASIVAEQNQPAPGLEQALHTPLTNTPNPVVFPGTALAGTKDQPAEPGLAAATDRLANLTPSAPTGEKSAPVPESEPDDSTLMVQPSGPICPAGPATTVPDAAPVNSAAIAGPPAATAAHEGDVSPPAGQPGPDQISTPDQGREALEKLRELNDLTGRNSMLMTQMFDSMIQSQRAAARIQTAQQAEINALTAQLLALQAQAGNARFNSR